MRFADRLRVRGLDGKGSFIITSITLHNLVLKQNYIYVGFFKFHNITSYEHIVSQGGSKKCGLCADLVSANIGRVQNCKLSRGACCFTSETQGIFAK